MDFAQLAEQHGPLFATVVAVLAFVRQALANGIKLTVTHDPAQMAELKASIESAAGQADRLAVVEGVQDAQAAKLSEQDKRITTVEVQLGERTRRASSLKPPASKNAAST